MKAARGLAWGLAILALGYCLFVYLYRNGYVVWFSGTHNDFKHLYFGALALRRGLSPYDFDTLGALAASHFGQPVALNPFVYPPFTGTILSPLTAWPFSQAAHAWIVANHFFLLGAVALVLWALNGTGRHPTGTRQAMFLAASAFALVMLASFPNYRNLSAGQLNGILLILIALALACEARSKPYLAVICLALAAMIKLTPGILLLHYVLRGQWKVMGTFFAAFLVLTGLSLLSASWEVHMEFLPLMAQMGYGSSTNAALGETFYSDVFNQAPSAFWYRLLTDQSAKRAGTVGIINSPILAKTLSYATALVIVGLTAYRSWRLRRYPDRRVFALALWIFPMLLGPSLMWDHYLVILIPAIMLMAAELVRQRRTFAWLAFGIPLVMISMPYPFYHDAFKNGLAVAGISYYTLAVLILFGLALHLARFPSGNNAHEHEPST